MKRAAKVTVFLFVFAFTALFFYLMGFGKGLLLQWHEPEQAEECPARTYRF